MSEFGRQLSWKSRDQYDTAIQWPFLLVVIGMPVNVPIFSRAIEVTTDLRAKREAVAKLSSMHETAEGAAEKGRHLQ